VRSGQHFELPRSPKALSLAIRSLIGTSVKTDFVRLLLGLEWQADAPDGGSNMPLHAASGEGQDDLVEMLLSRNANPNARDGRGKTALHYAFSGSSVALLLRRGADPSLADNEGFAPLHIAAKQGAEGIVRVLLGLDEENDDAAVGRARADVNLKGPQGWTALHYAHESLAMTCCLLESEPTPGLDNVTEGGETPLVLAAANGPDDVVH
jgi:ankyrin repeat protein